VEVVALPRAELDITNTADVAHAIREHSPRWVFNGAGMTNVDAAEVDRETAFAVNATAVEAMARLCRERDVRLLHFSSDYVFDGDRDGFYAEDDAPHPINVYGETKLAGDVGVQRSGVEHLIVRPQWLFGTHGRSFVGLMFERAQARQPTRVIADQTGCCTYTVDLAATAWELIARTRGLVHVANRGKVTRHALASRIFRHFQAESLLAPCSSEEFGSRTRRPANSALSVRRVERVLGRAMPPWEDAIDRYLIERDAMAPAPPT
jgi:dTDP-4-dehydrorhamnose reductase